MRGWIRFWGYGICVFSRGIPTDWHRHTSCVALEGAESEIGEYVTRMERER